MITAQEAKWLRAALFSRTSIIPSEGFDGTMRLKHDVRFGPGYVTVSSVSEVLDLVPEIADYPGLPEAP